MRARGDGRIYRRGSVPWIAYYHRGGEVRESAAGLVREVVLKKGRKLTDDEETRVTEQFLKTKVT